MSSSCTDLWSTRLRNLSIVVQDVGIIASAETLRDRQQLELQQITDGCQKVLENLETALNKYHDLSNDNKRIKSAWKRLTWEPEDIRDLRSRICVHVGLLNAFNGRLTRDITAKLIHYQDAQKHQELVHWLSPFDFAAQHADYVSRQQSGTGQWLLNSTEFQTFVTKPSQILFSPGIPGAWKTILTSIIIEELHARFQNEDEVGMAYVYCSYQRKYTLEDLLAILLKQLIQRMQSVPKDFVDLYHCYKRQAGRLSLRELRKWFQCATSLYSKVFIIVDALDECNISFALLPELFALQTLSHVNLFATSRCLPNIATKFGDTPSLEIRASDEDIQTYLKENIPRLLPSFVSRNPNLQEEIIAIILSAAGGV